jgi:putative YhbY family RNA-binding protein
MTAIQLTPASRKEKRGEAHHLSPVVMIGAEGLTPAVLKETELALSVHALIKVRVFSDDRRAREELLAKLAEELNAAPVQHIGKLLVLWRPKPEKLEPEETHTAPGPRTVRLVSFSKNGSGRPTVKKVQILGNQRLSAGGLIKRAKKSPVSIKKRAQGED